MTSQNWVSLVNPGAPTTVGAGAVLNTAASQTISPVTGNGADFAQINSSGEYQGWSPGLVVRVYAAGYLTTTATSTTATLFLASRVGNAGTTWVTLATANGITTGTTVITGIQWYLEALIRCVAVATTGNNVATMGRLTLGNSGAAISANPIALTSTPGMVLPIPNSAGESVAAVDTTQMQGISLRGTLAAAAATVQLSQWLVEALN